MLNSNVLNRLVIRAGLEPSISALKGRISDHADERTMWGAYPVAGPDRCSVRQNGLASFRPLPFAQLASSAPPVNVPSKKLDNRD